MSTRHVSYEEWIKLTRRPRGTRYTVRRLGCTAWASGLRKTEALRELRAADRVAGPGHVIIAHLPDGTTIVE